MSKHDLIRGALVADAASLGAHWIYDKARVAEVCGDTPEFIEPDVENYRGGAGYFAAKGKTAGDSSHYGKQLLIALESLAATKGTVDPADYEARFAKHFGPGGSWVGYIDYATRETLHNIDAATRSASAAAQSIELGEYENDRALIMSKVMANGTRYRGKKLDRAIETAVRITHDDEKLVSIVQRVAHAVANARGEFQGSDDLQLPAIASVPVTVACGAELEPAVRVTNNSDEAVEWARKAAGLLRGEIEPAALAGEGGPACPLVMAIPVIGRILAGADSFESGVRANILEGGDSCGRALIVGAYLGQKYGVPETWAERTFALVEAGPLLESLS